MLVAQGLDTSKIDEAIGRSGQKTGEVYRLGFPRTDLHVSVAGVEIKPGLALGSWAAFAGNDNEAMVMGDLVLLENELTPVMKKLRASEDSARKAHAADTHRRISWICKNNRRHLGDERPLCRRRALLRDSSCRGDHRSRDDTDHGARRSRGHQLPGSWCRQSCDNWRFRVDGGGS